MKNFLNGGYLKYFKVASLYIYIDFNNLIDINLGSFITVFC